MDKLGMGMDFQKIKKRPEGRYTLKNGDPDWTWTNDPYRVKVMLSQLSYEITFIASNLTAFFTKSKGF